MLGHETGASALEENAFCARLVLAVHFEPGVGFSGIGLTCTQPLPRALCFSASRSARHAWSFMSLMRAYSIDTRRPVLSK